MATYKVIGINVGSFNLGESDKVLTIFTAERALVRAVAKGARKPGTKVAGRADVLNVNRLLIAQGKSLDIIRQAETVETFPNLRQDLFRLTFGLYYAELTEQFGSGLTDESAKYLDYLRSSVRALADASQDPVMCCLSFELHLLEMLGYMPELSSCVVCRQVLTDFKLGAFHNEWGGVVCLTCLEMSQTPAVAEPGAGSTADRQITHITPLVWKHLVLAGSNTPGAAVAGRTRQPLFAAHRLMQGYIEHRAGRRMKTLGLLRDIPAS